jgi:MFS family permease
VADPEQRRRLPVLQSNDEGKGGGGEGEDRPPWHWSAIGAVATFVVWLPLAFLTAALLKGVLHGGDRIDPETASRAAVAAVIVLNALAFALGAFAAGLLVGRVGGKAGRREATVSGLAAAVIAWGYAAADGARSGLLVWALLLALMAGLGAGSAYLGGRLGLRLRR